MIEISVGLASCGISAGALKVYEEFKEQIKNRKGFLLKRVGCIGFCYQEPIVEIKKDDFATLIFSKVKPEDVSSILDSIINDKQNTKIFACRNDGKKIFDVKEINEHEFYVYQTKIVSEHCGLIDPEDINDYIKIGGYSALKKALSMEPEDIILEVKNSGIRGRGGAGFLTGLKWEFLSKSKQKTKYLICNFDEGDPGAFMNRVLVESNPHLLIEGILIASYALKVKKAFIYTRMEYPLAVKRLKIALKQARKKGFLGKNILASNFSVDIELRLGAGAFVCGEETALINSIQGLPGRPRPRPPYPAERGLWNKPTNINNVETLATIPIIINKGSSWYKSFGSKNSSGTKMFSLSGDAERTGYIEIPFGTKLSTIIKIAGVKEEDFKALQLGGPSGGFLSKENVDLELDYDSVKNVDAIIGSGSMVLLNKEKDIVKQVYYGMKFIVSESCGQCVPCREGTMRMLEILEKIVNKNADFNDLTNLNILAITIKQTSLCGLGQTAPNLVLSSLKHFFNDYEEKISDEQKKFYYFINEEKCTGCHICFEVCPKKAISGKPREIHNINQDLCIKCGMCYNSCPIKAIEKKEIK
ncbi:MAG: NADH-ubiquinone oxidoreductase-F iron-sulfur binding region domain-containing protein [Candidatus Woesearchaeota archaeon]